MYDAHAPKLSGVVKDMYLMKSSYLKGHYLTCVKYYKPIVKKAKSLALDCISKFNVCN